MAEDHEVVGEAFSCEEKASTPKEPETAQRFWALFLVNERQFSASHKYYAELAMRTSTIKSHPPH